MATEKHLAEMEAHKVKIEGAHLDNAMKTQKIADSDAQVNAGLPGNSSGLVPSAAQSFDHHPSAFGPRVPDAGKAPTNKHVMFHRGPDGKIQAATIAEVMA